MRLESNSGAAYFKHKNLDGAVIIVAYIMDMIRALSWLQDPKMIWTWMILDVFCSLKCQWVLGMKSATCRAI